MENALRIGVAGLGTVGASLVRLLQERSALLGDICGRRIEIAAVSARDRTRERGIDLDGMEWFDDPVAMAGWPGIDVFVELMGGEGDPAAAAVRAALAEGATSLRPTRLCSHATASNSRALPRSAAFSSISRLLSPAEFRSSRPCVNR